jgi:hypothetical protein
MKDYILQLTITISPTVSNSSEIYLKGTDPIEDEVIQLGLLKKAQAIIEDRIKKKAFSQNISLKIND